MTILFLGKLCGASPIAVTLESSGSRSEPEHVKTPMCFETVLLNTVLSRPMISTCSRADVIRDVQSKNMKNLHEVEHTEFNIFHVEEGTINVVLCSLEAMALSVSLTVYSSPRKGVKELVGHTPLDRGSDDQMPPFRESSGTVHWRRCRDHRKSCNDSMNFFPFFGACNNLTSQVIRPTAQGSRLGFLS